MTAKVYNKTVPVAAIAIDGDTQSRVCIDQEVVNEYAELMKSGLAFPPSVVFFDGVCYHIADGFHRHWAYVRNAVAAYACEVHEGTVADARWYAAGANTEHGLRRTNDDKRRAVQMAIAAHGEMSNRAIAEHCKVSDFLVSQLRPQVQEQAPAAVKGRDGKTYAKRPPPPPPSRQQAAGEPPVAEPPVVTKPPPAPPPPPSANPNYVRLYKDEVGRDIPAYLNDVWTRREWLDHVRQDVMSARYEIETGHREGDKCIMRVGQGTLALLKRVEREIADAMPYALCPICQGADGGCKVCRDTGFVSKTVWDTAIDEKYKTIAK